MGASSLSQTIDDLRAITATVTLYFEACREGSAAKFNAAFHKDAWIYGMLNGERADVTLQQMIDLIAEKPTGPECRTQIASIVQNGDIATVVVAEDNFWGMAFIDHFNLARFDGAWKIVNKVYFQAG